MARKKVKLAWIINDAARKATYKKRKKGLLKKVSELSTLCGVEASALVFGPNEPQPEAWPSVHEAQRILLKFKTLPEMDQEKKMMNQEGFFRQKIGKLKEQAKRWKTENREMEMDALMYQCLRGRSLEDLTIEDLTELRTRTETKAKAVQQRMEKIKRTESLPQAAKETPGFWAAARGKVNRLDINDHKPGNGEATTLQAAMEALQRQQWLVEMMNPHEQQGVANENEALIPFVDPNSWFDAFMGDI
ncbi:agamous-like MADS-box protein AGL80 [Aristolochia californica]|uniref:agamous-like MADS-box protein AGL80 n=1 Tax=Aristolochia californica TaxID=171875 RepID=UPI0035E2E037